MPPKKPGTTQNSVVFPDEIYDRIRELARIERRSIQTQVLVLLEEALAARDARR